MPSHDDVSTLYEMMTQIGCKQKPDKQLWHR